MEETLVKPSMPEYIQRMEQEFKETYDRYVKGKAYLNKQISVDETPDCAGNMPVCGGYHPNQEIEMLQSQIYSMQEYLRTLGSRIAFAKAKEGVL